MIINQDIVKYLSKQKSLAKERLIAYVQDQQSQFYPQRDLYHKLWEALEGFLNKTIANRWIIVPGLRGVGKTTLMAQLYLDLLRKYYLNLDLDFYFISLDEVSSIYNSNLNEIIQAIEYLEGEHLEKINKRIVLFLDEVQYDKQWSIIAKTVYDRTKNFFILASGSSAIALQSNADVARRAIFEKLTPLSFIEYQTIINKDFDSQQAREIQKQLREILFASNSAEDLFNKLSKFEKKISTLISSIDEILLEDYLCTGTLPFALGETNKIQIYNSINQILDRIIDKDVCGFGNFDSKTSSKIKRLLFILADIDVISVSKLSEALDMDRIVVNNVLEALEKTELIIKASAYGNNLKAVRKPAKYLFMSPALRMTFYNISGEEQASLSKQGKLLEDLFASYFYQNFLLTGLASLNYDANEASADFVLQIANKRKIAIELGLGQKESSQLIKTMKKIKCNYGILFSSSKLFLDKEHNLVRLPKEYLLLA